MNEKCEICRTDGAHYAHSDALGFWHFYCDAHDPRPLFQENLKLKTENLKLKTALDRLNLAGKAKND